VYLIEIRGKLGLSQREMAELLGVKQTNYSTWERGKFRPWRKRQQKILEILNPPDGVIVYELPPERKPTSNSHELIERLIEELGEEESLRRLLQNFGEKSRDSS
jgi:transcriptional regulator with XRE-family HTH domain